MKIDKKEDKMNKKTKKILDSILWILGIIALILLIYGIINLIPQNKKVVSWKECDTSKAVETIEFQDNQIILNINNSLVDGNYPSILSKGEDIVLHQTEECTVIYKLLDITSEKAVVAFRSGCAPPGPDDYKECTFEVYR